MARKGVRRSVFLPITVSFTYVALLLPLVLLVWLSFSESSILRLPPLSYSLKWYLALVQHSEMGSAFIYSAALAGSAAIISTMIGTVGALASGRSSKGWVTALEALFTGPIVVPALITGVALYIFLYQVSLLFRLQLVPSIWSLLAAHVIITLPWIYRLIMAGLASLPQNVERASLDLGRTPWGTFRLVTLPLIRSSIVGAVIVAFIWSFADLEISLFLVTPGSLTLPVAMVQYAQYNIDPTLAAVATIQILLIGVFLVAATRVLKVQEAFTDANRR